MDLYELNLHFPATYKSLGNEELTLQSLDYYESPEAAIGRAKAIAEAFVTPKPDYWYLEDGAGLTIWTDSPEEVSQAIRFDLMAKKPVIKPVTSNNEQRYDHD